MPTTKQLRVTFRCLLAVLLSNSFVHPATPQEKYMPEGTAGSLSRSVTVRDCIRMIQLGDLDVDGHSARYNVARFSPNGDRFVILVKKGNLEQNTNDYSLLIFQTSAVRGKTVPFSPENLLSLSSSSSRPGIQQVRWIDDHTVAFLGEAPGEITQLYTIDCNTKEVKKITDHRTSLTAYAINADGGSFFFIAERAVESLFNAQARRHGVVVSTQWLLDLITLESRFQSTRSFELFAKQRRGDREIRINTVGSLVRPRLWLSPNSRYLVVQTSITESPPASWREYKNQKLKNEVNAKHIDGEPFYLYQLELVDAMSGESHVLVNAPAVGPEVAWSSDSETIAISGTYLPLDGTTAADREARRAGPFVAEIKLPGRAIVPITDQPLRLRRWDARSGEVLLQTKLGGDKIVDLVGDVVAYKKIVGRWERIGADASSLSESRELEITLREDLNTPPRVFARNLQTGENSLLLDLNPQFRDLKFGRVEDITFRAMDGRMVKGGLYLPSNYRSGKRYPLVIQTHGWNPERFWIDGPYTTAFAAQPLAGKEIVVVQLEQDDIHVGTPLELHEALAAFEGVIEELDGRGLIDRDRVGLIGFSRTGLHVEHALTHSKYAFAAATLANITDGGYFEYVALLNQSSFPDGSEGVNGAAPYGSGLATWLKESPGFNLDKVTTPVRMEVGEPFSLLPEWEWFTGLNRLGKPVELIYMPDAAHVLIRPSERMASQQGNVDWFCFWLKSEEDRDPGKAEQYSRWRELRQLQMANDKKAASDSPPLSH
jgi:hypothetical protein